MRLLGQCQPRNVFFRHAKLDQGSRCGKSCNGRVVKSAQQAGMIGRQHGAVGLLMQWTGIHQGAVEVEQKRR